MSLVGRKFKGQIPERNGVRESQFNISGEKRRAKDVVHHTVIGKSQTRSEARLSRSRSLLIVGVGIQKLLYVLVEEVTHPATESNIIVGTYMSYLKSVNHLKREINNRMHEEVKYLSSKPS